MPVFEVTSRVTRRSLMNRTKDVLASCVLELHNVLDREQARRGAAEARVKAAEDALLDLTPHGSEFFRRNPDRFTEQQYLVDVPACISHVRDARERMRQCIASANRARAEGSPSFAPPDSGTSKPRGAPDATSESIPRCGSTRWAVTSASPVSTPGSTNCWLRSLLMADAKLPPEVRMSIGSLNAYQAAEERAFHASIVVAVACGQTTFEEVEAKLTTALRKRMPATRDADLPQVGSFHG